MFDNDFINCVKSKKYYKGYTDIEYDLYSSIKYALNHPEHLTTWEDNIRRITVFHMEYRNSTPDFIKDIRRGMRSIFTKNPVSCHSFVGLTSNNKSFRIHKDKMDVLYLQAVGEVVLSIWESESDEFNLDQSEADCMFKQQFKPGDWIWIPRGTYHLIEPLGDRVGLSFGVEGDIDPSTYVN